VQHTAVCSQQRMSVCARMHAPNSTAHLCPVQSRCAHGRRWSRQTWPSAPCAPPGQYGALACLQQRVHGAEVPARTPTRGHGQAVPAAHLPEPEGATTAAQQRMGRHHPFAASLRPRTTVASGPHGTVMGAIKNGHAIDQWLTVELPMAMATLPRIGPRM
jgi:hypothetical protein